MQKISFFSNIPAYSIQAQVFWQSSYERPVSLFYYRSWAKIMETQRPKNLKLIGNILARKWQNIANKLVILLRFIEQNIG